MFKIFVHSIRYMDGRYRFPVKYKRRNFILRIYRGKQFTVVLLERVKTKFALQYRTDIGFKNGFHLYGRTYKECSFYLTTVSSMETFSIIRKVLQTVGVRAL